ncbi:MAG: hypothetical protein AB2604_01885 [Candidatus Thiodiazotropha taylori]
MTDDWTSGSPQRLKDIEISKLEEMFSDVVKKIVGSESPIDADISYIDFSPHGASGAISGTVELKITFSSHLDTDFLNTGSD